MALLASFVLLGLTWTTPRLEPARGVPLPLRVTQIADSAPLRWTVRGVGLAIGAYMTMALVLGRDLLINPIFGFVYVWVWVGLVPISLLLGPVLRTLNPLRTVHLLAWKGCRLRPGDELYRISNRVGVWPAVIGLYAFVWLELIAPDRITIPTLMFWIGVYVGTMACGSVYFGRGWFAVADPFESYATLIAKLSPWGRDPSSGCIVIRNPLQNLATLTPRPGTVAFVAVLLGSTAYDGFSNSTIWVRWLQNSDLPPTLTSTAVLTLFMTVVLISFSAAAHTGDSDHSTRRDLPQRFVHSLVPIALGYVVAHYFTLFIYEGQRTLGLVSDPLSRGWDVFGTAGMGLNLSLLDYPAAISAVQAGAVVTGHIIGVIAAHDRALALFPKTTAVRGQIPLLIVMIGYTVTGLLLLFSV